jgi:hypothetical protein
VATPTAPHVIRLATGNYTLNNTLELCSNVYWDGGYDESQQWKKTNASKTILNRTTANPETSWPPRLIGIRGVNASNFQLHDLVLNVQGYPGLGPVNHGTSVYGIYLNNCSNYRIVRVEANAGRGSNGANGPNGAAGLNGGGGCTGGAGGQSGGVCSAFGCNNCGAGAQGCGGGSGAGGAGGNAPDLQPGQAGGNGGTGGGGGWGGLGASTNPAKPGSPGNAGGAGAVGGPPGQGGPGAAGGGGGGGGAGGANAADVDLLYSSGRWWPRWECYVSGRCWRGGG